MRKEATKMRTLFRTRRPDHRSARGVIRSFGRKSLLRFSVAPLALLVVLSQVMPAFATIDNTVTVSGTKPDGNAITATATENVDVVNDAPAIQIVKSVAFATGGDSDGDGKADAGDVLAYTYVVTNTGNVTLRNVAVTDAHDGAGAALSIAVPTSVTTDNGTSAAGTLNDSSDTITGDGNWDKLGPGDVITFTATYTVVAADISGSGGGTGTGFSGN
ncbi:MAG: DUF11 domain-containing protein, partial [Caldilineaceae bacterium]|nr:DUF11 domain-containing protein [Caldilineaceae bacterium]